MNNSIGDNAAIVFSVGFYKAFGANCSIEKAYRLGCSEIELQGIPENLTPVLYTKYKEGERMSWTAPDIIPAAHQTDLKRTSFDKNNVDYFKIEELLKIRRWKAADEETRNLIVKVAKREKEGWLDISAVQSFPCDVLMEIDRLWVNHSEGRFGFSIQNKIYQECGGKLDDIYDEKAWNCFARRVRWQVKNQRINYEEVTFNISAPLGHLPLVGFWEQGNQDAASLLWIYRMESCELQRLE
ncbi:MAG: GUN4 domain-containing protein [Potamolinea sp.]